MKQQCKCGNWVEGKLVATFARKLTRNAVGKGGAKVIGAAIGTVFGGSVGTAAGMAVGALLDDQMKKVSDSVEDVIFDNDTAEYEFCCPNCGRKWKTSKFDEEMKQIEKEMESSIAYSQNNQVEKEQEKFGKHFDWCVEHTEDAVRDYKQIKQRYTDIIRNLNSEAVKGEYYLLLAWLKLVSLKENFFWDENCEVIECDTRGIKEGESYITQALRYLDGDSECQYFKSMYSIWNKSFDTALQYILENRGLNRVPEDNCLFNREYLYSLWKEVAVCYFDLQYALANNNISPEEGFRRAKKLLDSFKFAKGSPTANPEWFNMWLTMADYLAVKYVDGSGCAINYAEALKLATITSENGHCSGLFTMAYLYGNGYGVDKDGETQKMYLQKILDGAQPDTYWYDRAKKEMEELNFDAPKLLQSNTINSDSEQEYIDTLKDILADGEISDRERRLLEKLRMKLGLTTERAAELEASLAMPQLTEEEQEYLNEYREIIAEGEISPRERKLLDKIRKMNGISEERAKELEAMV